MNAFFMASLIAIFGTTALAEGAIETRSLSCPGEVEVLLEGSAYLFGEGEKMPAVGQSGFTTVTWYPSQYVEVTMECLGNDFAVLHAEGELTGVVITGALRITGGEKVSE